MPAASVTNLDAHKRQQTVRPGARIAERLQLLLSLEAEAMSAPDRSALRHLAVNNARKLVPYGHAIFFARDYKIRTQKDSWVVKSVSSQGVIDRTSPFISWLESSIDGQVGITPRKSPHVFVLSDEASPKSSDENAPDKAYPFSNGLWVPLTENAGLLFTSRDKWRENDITLLARLCQVYGCTWRALAAPAVKEKPSTLRRTLSWSVAALAFIAFCWPVSMTTLAPAEVVAASPQIIAAPINGVIEKIHIAPNTFVQKGDILATYVDTIQRNELDLLEEEVAVAEARLRKTMMASFGDKDTKREIGVMRAELDLAKSRRDYAREKVEQITLRAQSDGLLLYTDKDDWSGRPVVTGERIMTIANPDKVELKIETPVSDGELLKRDARVRLFLDAAPLRSLQASLVYADYHPEPTPDGALAYKAIATFDDSETPRLGARGVAKIYGERAPFGFWVLRKPIVSIRQFFGL